MLSELSEINRINDVYYLGEGYIPYISLINKMKITHKIYINDLITKKMKKKADKIYAIYRTDPFRDDKKLKANRDEIIRHLRPLFNTIPRIKKICEYNDLVDSCFTRFDFRRSENDEDETLINSKYIIKYFGHNLTELKIQQYASSDIMPLIRDHCPSLKTLVLKFEIIENQDFENVFSKMVCLEKLMIDWECEDSIIPLTLINSLKQVGETLQEIYLTSKYNSFLPDSFALVFPQLIALKRIQLCRFQLSESSIQSLDVLKNLTNLQLDYFSRPVIAQQINMYPTVNLKNLVLLRIGCDYNVTDEFLINVCNTSKKLKYLNLPGTNITDDGMAALNNLSQLDYFSIGLNYFGADTLEKKNEFITHQSLQNLSIDTLSILDISNCTKISNESVIKLVENLKNLIFLNINDTKVTIDIVKELSKLKIYRPRRLRIHVSFDDNNGIFKSLIESHHIEFYLN